MNREKITNVVPKKLVFLVMAICLTNLWDLNQKSNSPWKFGGIVLAGYTILLMLTVLLGQFQKLSLGKATPKMMFLLVPASWGLSYIIASVVMGSGSIPGIGVALFLTVLSLELVRLYRRGRLDAWID